MRLVRNGGRIQVVGSVAGGWLNTLQMKATEMAC